MADRWAGVAFMLFGIAQAALSLGLGLGTAPEPGPGLIPFLTGAVTATLGLALVLLSPSGKTPAPQEPAVPLFPPRLLVVGGALLAYPLLLEGVGFLLVTTAVLTMILRAFSGAHLGRQVGVAAILVLVSYLIFTRWLGIPLPGGVLAF